MEFKKRKADLQLTADNYEDDSATSYGSESLQQPSVDSVNTAEVKATEPAASEEEKPAVAPVLGGFSSYAKSNPFAQAMANSGNNSFASTPVSSFGAISASKSNFNMPPSLVLPSPKSPKANPFSSPSPANTQFVTIVDNNDLLWKTMANDKLSADETAKSNTFVDNKTTSFRSAFFGGGNGHTNTAPSSFASVSATAATAPSSAFGSTTSSSIATPAATSSGSAPAVQVFGATGQDDDAGDDDNDEQDDAEDGGEPSSPTTTGASMKIISLPENVKLVTGEEEDECLLQIRAKLYRLHTGAPQLAPAPATTGAASAAEASEAATAKMSWLESALQEKKAKSAEKDKAAEWVEVGIGPLKILSTKGSNSNNNTESSAASGRLVMRREDKQHGLGTKLLLNVRLNKLLQVTRQSDKMLQLVCVNYADLQNTNAAVTIGTFLIKTKTSEEADDVYEIATDFVKRSIAADSTQSTGSTEDAPAEAQS